MELGREVSCWLGGPPTACLCLTSAGRAPLEADPELSQHKGSFEFAFLWWKSRVFTSPKAGQKQTMVITQRESSVVCLGMERWEKGNGSGEKSGKKKVGKRKSLM